VPYALASSSAAVCLESASD